MIAKYIYGGTLAAVTAFAAVCWFKAERYESLYVTAQAGYQAALVREEACEQHAEAGRAYCKAAREAARGYEERAAAIRSIDVIEPGNAGERLRDAFDFSAPTTVPGGITP